MAMKPTIRDIARLAGVSKSTVSRVLNHNTSVDATTRERVLRVIDEYHFVPDLTATQLARGAKRLVGIFVPALTWPFMPQLIQGTASAIEESSYEIILYSSNPLKGSHTIIERVLTTKLTAGLIAAPFLQSIQPLLTLYEQGLPLVVMNATATPMEVPWVKSDDVGGSLQATRHLLALGHRRIAFIFPNAKLPCYSDRYHGYCLALQEAGLEPDASLVFDESGTLSSVAQCVRDLLALAKPPTAVFVPQDYLAYQVLEVAKDLNCNVPDDLAIVGFDGIVPTVQVRPVLTTVRQPFYDIGRCAAEMLLSMLNKDFVPSRKWGELAIQPVEPVAPPVQVHCAENSWPYVHLQLPTTLMVGESCGARKEAARQDVGE